MIHVLGLHVERLYREQGSVVITGTLNRSQQTAAVFWRDNVLHGAEWLQTKMAEDPPTAITPMIPACLSFPGIERFTAIETVFVEEMNGAGHNHRCYAIAKAGGLHYGLWKNYRDRPIAMLDRAVKSLEQRITEHQAKIALLHDFVRPDVPEISGRAFGQSQTARRVILLKHKLSC